MADLDEIAPEDLAGFDEIDPRDLAVAEIGDTPDTALNESPPDPDFPSRFALQLGTTGPDQIAREITRKGFQAVAMPDGVKVRSKRDQKWYRFDPSGYQGVGELVSDVTDVAGDVLNTGAQIAGGIGGAAAGAGGGPVGAVAGGVAGAGLASGASDFLRTQLLGRALGYEPELGESVRSAGKEALVGAAGEVGGLAFRPFAPSFRVGVPGGVRGAAKMVGNVTKSAITRPGGAALRLGAQAMKAPLLAEQAVFGGVKRGLRSLPFGEEIAQDVRRFGPGLGYSKLLGGGFWAGVGGQAATIGGYIGGNVLDKLSQGYGTVLLSNLAQTGPLAFRPVAQRIVDAYLSRGVSGAKLAISAALRSPGVKEWLEEEMGGAGPAGMPDRAPPDTEGL
jgi:hypothetical protein